MIKKKIFGKVVQFECTDTWKSELHESLELYSDVSDKLVDVRIQIVDEGVAEPSLSMNPKIFRKLQGGFAAEFRGAAISWRKDSESQLTVQACVKDPFRNALVGLLKRLRSMEFPTRLEWFEQVLHELILVPTAHFFADLAIVHAAAIGNESGCFLFTGTGGVGKSSALLSVAGKEGVGFLADDVVVVDKKGLAYGNFSWPKIYGYNCTGTGLASRLLAPRGILDRAHFYIRNRVNPSTVRRKIRPDDLFSKCLSDGVPVKGVYFLFREPCQAISVSDSSTEKAITSTIEIIKSEYDVFYKILRWDRYNSIMLGVESALTIDGLERWWRASLANVFEGEVKKIAVPYQVDHADYLSFMEEFILERITANRRA